MSSSTERFRSIIADIDFHPLWDIVLTFSKVGQPYLQVRCLQGPCAQTGDPITWTARKWMLSEHMSDTEVVKTALKAVLAAVEHEALENFHYKGKSIFNPHFSVEALLYASCQFELDGRPAPKPFECDEHGHAFVQQEFGTHENGTLRYTLNVCSRCGLAHKRWYDRDERPTPAP